MAVAVGLMDDFWDGDPDTDAASRVVGDPVQSGDLDACLRKVEDLTATRSWADLEQHRTRCLAAFERGHQLWPAAHAATYRLALEAPAEFAVPAMVEAVESTFFGFGPLTEVIASRLTWSEAEPHLPPGPTRSTVAEERIIRGEDLSRIDRSEHGTSPLLSDWEPSYTVAQYRFDSADFGTPPLHRASHLTWTTHELAPIPAGRILDDDDVTHAFGSLTAVWTEQSNGRCETAGVSGSATDAIAALGVRTCTVASITVADAVHAMAWAAASGGAHGRRRGMSAGRFDAWWALAAACNLTEYWPIDPVELGEAASELRWYAWRPGTIDQGWELHLAVEDPVDEMAWVISAIDAD